ncbi:MAG: GtrA family protein [Alphaproteobacteria bacterium]|nr:GtrA family protein [Alphaproteobacteria bacterium]
MIAALYQRFSRLPQPVRYVLAGGYNTAFGFVSFALLQLWLGAHMHYLAVLTLNFFIAVANAFLVLKYLVFRTRGNLMREYARCTVSYLVLLAVNMLLLKLLVDGAGVRVILAQFYCTVFIAAAGYVLHKKFSFSPIR